MNVLTLPALAIVTLEVLFCTRPLLIVVKLAVVAMTVLVPKLPVLALPLMFAVPAILAPVPVTVKIAAFPADPTVMLPLPVTITLLVPLIRLPAVATFRLATCVVLVTVKGAVPVAILLVKLFAVIAALTLRPVSVPTEVMFA